MAIATVMQGPTVVWKFLIVRPSVSSGTNASGAELRYVDYKGTRVLFRAHVPVVNVQYKDGSSNPWRDWMWEEEPFQADTLETSGIADAASASTIVDSGDDNGNFHGVAITVEGNEVVLRSELQADWYRYAIEWHLAADGTIKPRFGFTAVASEHVCHLHIHHAYWRFDFDIGTPGNNDVQHYQKGWTAFLNETALVRQDNFLDKLRVINHGTGKGYEVVPGPNDGQADTYGRADNWILQYRATELDDGNTCAFCNTESDVGKFVNGEAVKQKDVVLWYGAKFIHDVSAQGEGIGEIVGPDLLPLGLP
jgi:hypothetical protein